MLNHCARISLALCTLYRRVCFLNQAGSIAVSGSDYRAPETGRTQYREITQHRHRSGHSLVRQRRALMRVRVIRSSLGVPTATMSPRSPPSTHAVLHGRRASREPLASSGDKTVAAFQAFFLLLLQLKLSSNCTGHFSGIVRHGILRWQTMRALNHENCVRVFVSISVKRITAER